MTTSAMKLKDACSFEEKLTNLYKFFKSRDITLLKKFSINKAMILPVVMHGCDWSSDVCSSDLLMKVIAESEKVGLKLNIQKTKIMAFGPITSLQIDEETAKTSSRLSFWGLQNKV